MKAPVQTATLSTPATARDVIHREGLTILEDPEGSQWDIVFIHGLNGHPHRSWTNEKSGFYWPSMLLTTIPNARLMAFGYISDLATGSHNRMGIRQHAESLLLHLRNNRQNALLNRPLVFVCHSLGGLVTKEALILDARKQPSSKVLESTKLIVFLGTPHRGSYVLESKTVYVLEKIAKAAQQEIPPNLKSALKVRSDELFDINEDFVTVKRDTAIVSFYEQKDTKIIGDLVVDKDSAALHCENAENIPLYRDHRDLIRFENAEDDTYRQICQTIGRKLTSIADLKATHDDKAFISDLFLKCIESLGTTGSDNRLTEIVEPSEHTLDWLWKDDTNFTHWLAEGRDTFWVNGKPGSGKSVLMKEVSSGAQKKHMKPKSITARHFFNSRGTAKEQSFEAFLRSILKQILEQAPDMFEFVVHRFREQDHKFPFAFWKANRAETPWTLRTLKDTLNDIVAGSSCIDAICIFVDALDECENMSIGGFGSYFKQLCDRATTIDIKICCSSRHVPDDFLTEGAKCRGLVIQDKNSEAIARFVNDRWASTVSSSESSTEETGENLQTFKNDIIARADGVFLWVNIVLGQMESGVEDGNSISELRESLNAIPGQLSGLFSTLLDSIKSEYLSEANTMLSLVLCAARPITLAEFRYALAFSSRPIFKSQLEMNTSQSFPQTDVAMIKRIRSRCGALVEIKNLGGNREQPLIVQFIHQSVKEYLLSKDKKANPRLLSADELKGHGNEQFIRASLRYLSMEELRKLPSRLENSYYIDPAEKHLMFIKKYPFLDYSVCNWIKHYHDAEKLGSFQYEELDRFCQVENNHLDTWWEIHSWMGWSSEWIGSLSFLDRPDTHPPSDDFLIAYESDKTAFQLAINHNLIDYVRRRIDAGEDVTTLVEDWGSYLMLAACRGHEEIVELLLKHGAAVNIGRGADTPLVGACFNGRASTVKKLLQWNADTTSGGEAHIGAAASGNWEVVQALHEHDPYTLQNGLHRHEAILMFFVLSRLKGLEGGFPVLDLATETLLLEEHGNDHSKIVDLLTAPGVDYDYFEDSGPWIQWLVISGSPTNADLHLAGNGDINFQGTRGVTLLHLACFWGKVEIVRNLVESGADLKACMYSGISVLHAAARNKSEKPLEYLLSLGLDPNVLDENLTTPLHIAAAEGTDRHVKALLAKKADVSAKDSSGFLALHYAMSNWAITNSRGVLDDLANSGLLINNVATDNTSPLHISAKYGNPSSVEWLLRRDAKIDAVDNEGRTVLHAAAANSDDKMGKSLSILISKGADVVRVDDAGMSPLHSIFFWQNRRFEFNLGQEAFARDQKATFPQDSRIKVRIVVDNGADVNAQDLNGTTALHLASANSNGFAIPLLLERGAKKDLRDCRNCLPFDLAKRDDIRSRLKLD